jgi:hypothetical protein
MVGTGTLDGEKLMAGEQQPHHLRVFTPQALRHICAASAVE